jgi:diguanylate cyclase (GGDEF)-like protein
MDFILNLGVTIIIRLLFLFTLLTVAWSVPAADSHKDKILTIAVSKTTYPFQFINEQGEPDGLMIDLWRLWAKKQQVNIQFMPLAWQQTLDSVAQGTVDIHAGLAQMPSRAAAFDFGPEFFRQNSYIYLHKKLSHIESIESLSAYTIGVVGGSSHIDILQQHYPSLSIRLYGNRREVYQAALNQEVLAFTDLARYSGWYADYQQLQTSYPNRTRLLLDDIRYGAAVKRGRTDLLAFINQGFAKLSLDEKNTIERKWLGLEKNRDELLLAFSTSLPPYMAISPSGRPQGLFIDLWRLWSEQTGQKVDFIGAETAQVLSLVQQQKADVHIAYPESELNSSGLLHAWKLYGAKSVVFVSQKMPNISSLSQLSGQIIGVFETAPYKQQLSQSYPNVVIRYFVDIDHMLAAAERGEIIAMVGSDANFSIRLINANLQSSFYMLDFPKFNADLFALVNPNNEALAKIIEQGFAQIPNEKMLAVEQKWLPDAKSYYFEHKNAQIQLTSEQKKWRANHVDINVGVVKHWAPVEFVDQQGKIQGLNKDIFDIISTRANIGFNYQVFESWELLLQALQNHQVDMVGGVAETEQRKQNFLFSKSYWSMPWALIHSKSLGVQANLKPFLGKRLAVVKGYYMVSVISEHYPQIELKLVDTPSQGLAALQQGLADGMIEPLGTASELLKQESLISLMLSVVDDIQLQQSQDDNHIMIRKDWPQLLSIIDQGIDSISPQERQIIYQKWFNLDVNTGFEKSMVLRLATQSAVVILLIIAVFVLWNRRLHQEVKQRKSLEAQMKHMATHDELTGLANRNLLKDQLQHLIAIHQRQKLLMAILFIDLDGFKTVNDTYGHNIGDELLVLLAERLKQCVRQSDTLARFGGDEFVILLTGLHQANEAAFIAEKIIKLLRSPFELSVVTTCVGCSIGIAMYPEDGITDTDLVKVADTLMYQVKAQGKNHYAFRSVS